MAALQNLEDGEAKKQSQMKWVDGANYGMLRLLPVLRRWPLCLL